jgi:3-phenylpropionate/trans-cinnamate dioxygenase ferredoxin subunit
VSDDEFERVARVEDVPERGVLSVVLEAGSRVCLARCDGEIFAINDNCTHEQFPMSEGYVLKDCVIECAWHGARFDLRSGAVLGPPAYSPLPTFHVKVENGEIRVGKRK